jgi:lipopolysaccharide transport system ATP-binding protein
MFCVLAAVLAAAGLLNAGLVLGDQFQSPVRRRFAPKTEKGLPMSSEIAIKVANLSKCYQIYGNPGDRLKQFLFPRIRRMLGLRDKQYFREFWALNDVSFEVRKGQTAAIIGRNGSGKSTFLQLICGTLSPTAGTIVTHGRIAALLELGSGFNPEFTGRENVYMNGSVLGLSTLQIDQRFDEIATFADIGEFIDQPVKSYSSGMMVRLAFAVIAHVDADILVVDEALAVGDAFFTQKCMRFLRNFMKEGTILFVSHDTVAVANLCSHAILLDHGRAVKVGSPKSIIELYLSSLYAADQNVGGTSTIETEVTQQADEPDAYRDMRTQLINESNLRNDIEVFRFQPTESGFGTGQAKIKSVRLLDSNETPLIWVVGGEDVIVEIRCDIYVDMYGPIVGFQLRDRLGQVIFADNTFLVYQTSPLEISRGSELEAKFEFRLPILPNGDYTLGVAIAEGTGTAHIQHHWMHDALVFRVHSSSVVHGLVGVSMKRIRMEAAAGRQLG